MREAVHLKHWNFWTRAYNLLIGTVLVRVDQTTDFGTLTISSRGVGFVRV